MDECSLPSWRLLLCGLLLGGCDRIEDWFVEGTQAGVERCMSRVATKLVGENQAKAFCISKHERELPRDKVTGTGGLRADLPNVSPYFGGTVRSVASDVIITSLSVAVRVKGTQNSGIKGYSDLALHSNEAVDIYLSRRELGSEPPKSENDDIEWTILAVRGIRLVEHSLTARPSS